MTLHFSIMTLFPEMFPGPLGLSLSGKALERKDWSYKAHNIRDFGTGTHKTVDDTPYGGGAGMVMRADVLEHAFLAITPQPQKRIYLSPRGKPLTQEMVKSYSEINHIALLCGRYEGIDQRFLDACEFEEISIGDYVLSGGEIAALALMDACIRLLPGVMGNPQTASEESFSDGLLEYPHYTRPAAWTAQNGHEYRVPEVLQNGNHKAIENWRKEKSLKITKKRRPDLIK